MELAYRVRYTAGSREHARRGTVWAYTPRQGMIRLVRVLRRYRHEGQVVVIHGIDLVIVSP
jgi:hypothetical protein